MTTHSRKGYQLSFDASVFSLALFVLSLVFPEFMNKISVNLPMFIYILTPFVFLIISATFLAMGILMKRELAAATAEIHEKSKTNRQR